VFEVPRNLLVSLGRVGAGLMLLVVSAVPCMCGGAWHVAAPFVLASFVILAASARAFLLRPPVLRATRAGLWFGGGAIIPWREIAKVYDAGRCLENVYGSTWSRELGIAFHRRGAVMAAAWPVCLTALPFRRAILSLETVEEPSASVVARLEAMRASGVDHELDGRSTPPPRARVVRR
jgi:hypothetical protein